MSNTTGRAARGVALIVALVVGGVLLVGSIIGTIPLILSFFDGSWNGRTGLGTARFPQVPVAGVVPEPGSSHRGLYYSGALVTSGEALVLPRVLQATAAGLGRLVLISASLLAVLLAVRLLRSRPFARLLAWGLAGVGFVAIAAATIPPQLEALAVDIAVQDLGFAIRDDSHDGWFTPDGPDLLYLNLWDPLWVFDRMDPTLLLLGVVLCILGFLVTDGVRMQRDTQGLV